jgi:hypothetical protein
LLSPCYAEPENPGREERGTMDYLDSSIRIAQAVLPPAIQYFGKAKE